MQQSMSLANVVSLLNAIMKRNDLQLLRLHDSSGWCDPKIRDKNEQNHPLDSSMIQPQNHYRNWQEIERGPAEMVIAKSENMLSLTRGTSHLTKRFLDTETSQSVDRRPRHHWLILLGD